MNDFRYKISEVLGIRILNSSDWQRIFSQLDQEGKPDRATMTKLLEVICQEIDVINEKIRYNENITSRSLEREA